MSPQIQNRPYALIALILFQAACAAIFVVDVAADAFALEKAGSLLEVHFLVECAAAFGLIAAIVLETRFLARLIRHKAHLERHVSLAAEAFRDIIDDHFDNWGLTAAEEDVARFTVKGASITDIAGYRGSAEGTIKSHLNAIYRKAGVNNRGELLSLLIDDMLGGPPAK
jgi:DNA-binding CsgD family transcriptional regulator